VLFSGELKLLSVYNYNWRDFPSTHMLDKTW
jgi:hypothetical protein